MARYIDADALKQKKVYSTERHECVVPVVEIDWQPTADVAPRAEVAREIFEEIERVVGYALCVDLTDWSAYTELKKKYTEGQK